jgi:tetratricopeptide (TPR) repeat protein
MLFSMGKDVFTQIRTAGSDEEREWLLLKMILDTLEPALHAAVFTAAIPHWFDANFLMALLDEAERQQLDVLGRFGRLITLELVEPCQWLVPGQVYNLDERSRAVLLNRMWQEEPERFYRLSQRAAAYCARQDQTNYRWRLETIYHLLVADPDQGATRFQLAAREWQNPPCFAYDKVESLTRLAGEHGTAGRLDERGQGWWLYWEAYLDRRHGRYGVAEEKLLQIRVGPEIDGWLAAEVALALGDVERVTDQYEAARESYQVAYALYRDLNDSLGEAKAIKSLGDVHFCLEKYGAAYQNYGEAGRLYREGGDRRGEANCIQAAGDVYRLLSEHSMAWQAYGEARFLYRQVGDRLGEAHCMKGLGDVHVDLWEHRLARQSYENARRVYWQMGEQRGEVNCLRDLANIHRLLGEYLAAGQLYEQGLVMYRDIGDQREEANCLKSLGDVHRALDDCDEIWPWYEAARYLHLEIGNYLEATHCLFGLADADLQRGNLGDAADRYQQALAYYEEVGMTQNVALTRWRLGLAAENMGELGEAEQHYRVSHDLFQQIGSALAENLAEKLAALQAMMEGQRAAVL